MWILRRLRPRAVRAEGEWNGVWLRAADRCLAALVHCVIEWIASRIWILHSSPTECFFAVGKCAHLNQLAVADGIDIRQPHLIPFVTAFAASPHVERARRRGFPL
jgi:hypothetical protein